ncbi:MAG TPA: aspartate aminotransferase family protein [Candidatus Dormibacteraeota bacterium]|nr:aspartate aminotransferase family protein [Candidatus Dormibacteraeota bacterium]
MGDSDLVRRHRAVMPKWQALYYDEPIALERGEGCYVWDTVGRRYLDFFGGILTTISGHSVPQVVAAVQEQAAKIMHSSTLYMIPSAVELAEQIGELSGIPNPKVFFTPSGTEAVEAALLMATSARRSNQVLALRNSYHGRSFAAIAVTGNRGWSATSYSPFHVSFVQNGYRYRSPFGHLDDDAFIKACADDLRNVIETQTAGQVACMIAEPIQGVGGFTVPPDGFFAAMKAVCDEYGILFIADEVQTGWGRTGQHFWGIQAHGVVPDAMVFAKGIGNGLALAGVVARADLVDSIDANSISTFGGNPLATVGALANLRYILDNDLQGNAREVGGQLLQKLSALQAPTVGEVRGRGLMIGVELVEPGGTKPSAFAANQVLEACKRGGLLVGKGGLYGNVLRVTPPLTLTPAQADEGYEILAGAITSVQG